ncbi:MAG: NAD(P)H-dependent oxidoreductase [Paracoccaceae bacterium]
MADLTILGIAGALRAASTNRLLLAEAQRAFGPANHMTADLHMPLYDEDIETGPGIPPEVQHLAEQIAGADAIIISTPEYNKAPPGLLKNALDWVSRTKLRPFRDQPVAIVSAGEGRGGGDRSQFALRLMLTPFRPRLLTGPEVMVAQSRSAFDQDGRLKEESYRKGLAELMAQLRTEAERSRAARAG